MSHRPITLLLDDLVFPEGPRWRAGRLWFSDMHAQEVVAVTPAGEREVMARVPQDPSGLGWLPDGRLLVVSMRDRRLLRQEADGELVEHADLSGLAAGRCNDMVVDGDGRAYVGNFGFDLMAGADFRTAAVVMVSPGGNASLAAPDLHFPNGTVITPDGRTMIVAESAGNRLSAFDLAADGTLSNRRVWAELGVPPDGICLDAEGLVWVAVPTNPGAFLRVAEGGEVRERIDLEGFGGFACMLGGAEERTLFLLEAQASHPDKIAGRGNGRIRMVEVEAPRAGWP